MNSRIFHHREKNTIRTIAYAFDLQNGIIRYGATVFHQKPGENWNRKNHIETARERFEKCPITVRFDPKPFRGLAPGGWEDYRKREEIVLNCMFKYGAYDKHNWTTWLFGPHVETFTTTDFYAPQKPDPISV